MKILNLLKKLSVDPITIVLGFMFLLLGFNYFAKYISTSKTSTNSNLKPLVVIKAKQVCVDNEEITECYPLDADQYKLLLLKNDKEDTYNILITTK